MTPHTDPALVQEAARRGLRTAIGFATPSEAFAALRAGAQVLKLFPAGVLGTAQMAALRSVLPAGTVVLAVGGVTPQNLGAFLQAGCAGAGLGSDLYKPGQAPAGHRRARGRIRGSMAAKHAPMTGRLLRAGSTGRAPMKIGTVLSLLLVLFTAAPGARAATSDNRLPKVAVVSLIGSVYTIVSFQPSTGSKIDRNLEDVVPLPNAAFDRIALLATEQALRRSPRVGTVALLELNLSATPKQVPQFLVEGRFEPPESLAQALQQQGATHLLLLARHRTDARLKALDASLGSGTLEGLGFYLDKEINMKQADTGEIRRGLLAPFAYFKLALVDLGSARVLKEVPVLASTTVSAARNTSGVDAWGALTQLEKMTTLAGFLKEEIPPAVQQLLEP